MMEETIGRVLYHTEHTDCMTYFQITGKFDPDEITAYLRIPPEKVRRIGDVYPNGTVCKQALWRFGTCTDYQQDVSRQMMMTLEQLLPKSDLLRKIKLTYDARLLLAVVPLVRYDEPAPALAPSLSVMRFCMETGTEIKIDLYVGCPDDIATGGSL